MTEQLKLDLDFGDPEVVRASFVRSPQDLVEAFHKATKSAIDTRSSDVVSLRHRLIWEESLELLEELSAALMSLDLYGRIDNLDKITKETGDLLYVVYGTAVALGINAQEAFLRVHASNMSKLVDGKVVLREDGKVLKGSNYFEPDMSGTYREENNE